LTRHSPAVIIIAVNRQNPRYFQLTDKEEGCPIPAPVR
jgi:hypothetical protein